MNFQHGPTHEYAVKMSFDRGPTFKFLANFLAADLKVVRFPSKCTSLLTRWSSRPDASPRYSSNWRSIQIDCSGLCHSFFEKASEDMGLAIEDDAMT